MKPDEFVENARTSPSDAEKNIISYVTSQNARLGKGEITAADVGNALKVIKLLLEMNDVTLNWKKIRRSCQANTIPIVLQLDSTSCNESYWALFQSWFRGHKTPIGYEFQ